MRRLVIMVIAFAAIFTGVFYLNSKESKYTEQKNSQSEISLEKIKDDIKNGALLVDVRSVQEFKEAHAKGAINISVEDIQEGARPKVAKDVLIYLYCRSGRRASIVENILKDDGYSNTINLKSLENWLSLGGQVDKT